MNWGVTVVNEVYRGTIVLAIRIHDTVYVGVDSKVISVSRQIGNVASQRKIHQTGDVVFAHAGIFKDSNGKIDVAATANSAIEAGGDLEQIVDHFTTAVEPQLLSVLPDIRAENPSYFEDKLKRPLEMIFVCGRGETTKQIVVFFEVQDLSAADLAVHVTRLRCPGDSPYGDSIVALGEHDAADRFLDTHSEILRTRGPIAAIEEAIASQSSATPEYVSLPVAIVSIDRFGIHILK